MAKKNVEQPFELTPEEMAAVIAARNQTKSAEPAVAVSDLAKALITAIEATRPPAKKNPFNRKVVDPWTPKDGSKKPKLKRAWSQHGVEMNEGQLYSDEIELLNKVKPGRYCNGLVIISKRKDRSYDLTWPVKTAAQRLRVLNEAGATLPAILQRCIDEFNDPRKFRGPDDDDE